MTVAYRNDWFEVIHEGKFFYINEPMSKNGAVILPVLDDHWVILIETYRPALKAQVLELPRGYGHEKETSLHCALRELHEETGYQCSSDRLLKLGSVSPNSGILSSKIDVFCARLTDKDSGEIMDTVEVKNLRKVSQSELIAMISRGEVTDAFTLSALLLYHSKLLGRALK